MSGRIELHGLAGPPGSALGELLGTGLRRLPPGGGGEGEPIVGAITATDADLAAAGADLAKGAARPEAMAARLRRRGYAVSWGEPVRVADRAELLRRCRERGRASVAAVEADPSLLGEMQVGSWFDSSWRLRALRRLLGGGSGRRLLALAAPRSPRWLAALADLVFWAGVREAAADPLWRRLTASSYTALVYHRFAGELKPGQERIDISPRRFGRHLWALRLAGYRPLPAERLLAFHAGEGEMPRRRVAITIDDGVADCLRPLARHSDWSPQLFVPTAELGGQAHWIDGEEIATWEQIRALAAGGVGIGSHTRHHRRLTAVEDEEREEELAGSLAELRQRLAEPLEILAYPNGDHDGAVCAAARAAGYRAAYTTEKGRNGAGTDPFRLRRVSVHGRDGVLAILWKAATGEGLPGPWLRLRGR